MKTSTRILVISCILVLFLTFAYWQPEVVSTETSVIPETQADYFLEQVSVSTYDVNGRKINEISADKIEHYKLNDESTVQAPEILMTSQKGTSWRISAQSGQLKHKTQSLTLEGQVDMVQNSIAQTNGSSTEDSTLTPEVRSSQLSTSELVLNLKDNIANTAQPVTIVAGQLETRADGLKANINRDTVELLGNVRTQRYLDEK